MLWNMLKYLGIKHERLIHKQNLLLTHDVDNPILWRSFSFFLKKLGENLLKRRDHKEARFSIKSYLGTTSRGHPIPYDTFDHLMTVAENANLPAYSSFMVKGDSFDPPRYLHLPFVKKLFQNISKRAPSGYSTLATTPTTTSDYLLRKKPYWKKPVVKPWSLEGSIFSGLSPLQLGESGRIKEWNGIAPLLMPISWVQVWRALAFPVFDVERRIALPLNEYPLTAMEGSLRKYQNLSPDSMLANLNELWATTCKYGGTFTLLWHNSAFNTPYYLPYYHLYKRFVVGALAANVPCLCHRFLVKPHPFSHQSRFSISFHSGLPNIFLVVLTYLSHHSLHRCANQVSAVINWHKLANLLCHNIWPCTRLCSKSAGAACHGLVQHLAKRLQPTGV